MKTIQIRLENESYAQANAVLHEIGLDMPTALRLFLRKVVQTRSIPFSLEVQPNTPTEPTSGSASVKT